MTGYASSVIACDAEAGVERMLSPDQTPDGRPGLSLLVFGFFPKLLTDKITPITQQIVERAQSK